VVRYLVGRVVWAASAAFAVSVITFVLFFVVPASKVSVANDIAAHGGRLGEYVAYLHHLTQGDLGRSRVTHEAVGHLVGQAIPATASLVVGGILVALCVAFGLGAWSALNPRSRGDRVGTGAAFLAVSAHPFWLSLITAWLFGQQLGWLPAQGYCDMFEPSVGSGCGGPVQWTYHLILPWLVFGAGFAALYATLTRATLLEELREDYVRTGRAKGLSDWLALRRHALRNAVVPLATAVAMDLGVAFGATMFVERVFDIPGLGRLAFASVRRRDLPVLLGVILTVSLVTIVASSVLDIVLRLADPRVRTSRPALAGRRSARNL
jgi:peptide/nickel transport system permease protein